MTYAFPPPVSRKLPAPSFWSSPLMNDQAIRKIIEYCDKLPTEAGTTGTKITELRNSKVAWVPFPSVDPETDWLYSMLAKAVQECNEAHFRLNTWGFYDNLQYTVYDAADGPSYYGRHMDYGMGSAYPGTKNPGPHPARKLSLSVQLSHPYEYEGGDLRIEGTARETMVKVKGMVHVFPSFMPHEVMPVTKGIRRALVGWVIGHDYQ